MGKGLFYSLITPIYNRPDEAEELLRSLAEQSYRNFEVLLIEDGSPQPSVEVADKYKDKLKLRYFRNPKAGPSAQRNFGFENAAGDYFILLDSDCIIPADYLEKVDAFLGKTPLDCFGGPDRAAPDFNAMQKAVSFAMTSFITTGGIRGAKRRAGEFEPRSFNMGLAREVHRQVGGFINMHPGEDIEFSVRIRRAGFRVGYIPDAWVYHKRRTSYRKFYRQVYRFGLKRIDLWKRKAARLSVTHFFPLFFTIYLLSIPVMLALAPNIGGFLYAGPMLAYLAVVFGGALARERSLNVAAQAVAATVVQMAGYGAGLSRNLARVAIGKAPL